MSRKGSARSKILQEAQNQIRGSQNLLAAVSRARAQVANGDLPALVNWLPSVRRNGRGVFNHHFVSSPTNLRRQPTLEAVAIEREIAWAGLLLRQNSTPISEFVGASNRYATALLTGSYKGCRDQLDSIELRFGASLWSIETRIALLQLIDGLEAQKAYAAAVLKSRGRHDLVSFMTFYISNRNEPNTTPYRFERQFEALADQWEVPADIKAYLFFRILNRSVINRSEFAAILRQETSSPLVDYYETFIRLAQQAMMQEDLKIREAFIFELRALSKLIDDSRLHRALFFGTAGFECLGSIQHGDTAADDAAVCGKYSEAAAAAAQCVTADPLDTDMWVARAQALMAGNIALAGEPSSLVETITSQMRHLIEKSDSTDDAVVSLLKLGINHRLQNFAAAIESLVWRELTSEPSDQSRASQIAFMNARLLRPSSMACLPTRQHREAVARILVNTCSLSASFHGEVFRADFDTALEQEFSATTPPVMTPEARVTFAIGRAFTRNEYENALSLARASTASRSVLYDRAIARDIGFCLLKLNRIDELISFVAQRCAADPGLVHVLPISQCADRLDKSMRKRLAGDLATPVVLDLFAKHVDERLNDVRGYAYEDFLIAKSIDRPSELDVSAANVDPNLMVYYLRYVCVPAVMQVSSVFRGTRELEDERKAVLSLLVKLDQNNAKNYETELREVARAQLIHRGVRHIEQSKIFVDVAAIRRNAEKDHRENITRYQALLRAGIGPDNTALNEAVLEVLSGKPLPQEFLEVPKSEATDILLQILRGLFGECIGSSEHGLDCYLSMRIRHGTLSGQLRTPLELQRIITQRAASTNKYEPNVYWLEQLNHINENISSDINIRLERFSADYDHFIAKIANELIQVRGPNKPNGLFDIGVKSVRFHLLVLELTSDMTFDKFFDRCMELFWESVESCLENVRSVIDGSLKAEVMHLFSELEFDIAAAAAGTSTAGLDRAIRTAQTGAQQALDLVKEWFWLSKPLSEPSFPIDDLIDVGLQCVKIIHRDFSPIVRREVPPLPPFAGALTLFSDIFFIIFDNIRLHSGLGGSPQVSVEVADLGDRLRLAIRSEIDPAVCTVESTAKIDRIRELIAGGDYQRAVSSEGGTGLIKLRKLISRGETPTRLDFGYENTERFYIDLEIRKREIML